MARPEAGGGDGAAATARSRGGRDALSRDEPASAENRADDEWLFRLLMILLTVCVVAFLVSAVVWGVTDVSGIR